MLNCGECTACCTVCVVPELNKEAGKICTNCEGGCQIYGNHPQSCLDFECAYYQGGKNIELRPDKCGTMFFKKNDRIFCGVVLPDKKVTNLVKGQIESLNKQGYSVIMMKIGEDPHIVLASGHNPKSVYEEYTGILKEWQLTAQI